MLDSSVSLSSLCLPYIPASHIYLFFFPAPYPGALYAFFLFPHLLCEPLWHPHPHLPPAPTHTHTTTHGGGTGRGCTCVCCVVTVSTSSLFSPHLLINLVCLPFTPCLHTAFTPAYLFPSYPPSGIVYSLEAGRKEEGEEGTFSFPHGFPGSVSSVGLVVPICLYHHPLPFPFYEA